MTLSEVARWIKRYEPFIQKIRTLQTFTIGYGRKLNSQGISEEEAQLMFNNDLLNALQSLEVFRWYHDAPTCVQYALIHITFCIEVFSLLEMDEFIEAIKNKQYKKAACLLLNTEWAIDEPERAKDCALMLSEGHATARTN